VEQQKYGIERIDLKSAIFARLVSWQPAVPEDMLTASAN
jgi:hypothetical protein